ncbi:SIR2 family protein [Tindallia californiensis]|uniref:SIR2-like domain-containing protein n=1 Tax=Tindallia californiensis TaxID=159292 RepID=A0A1H3QZ03_9FIRM|nr:SIR2 family protein [Tindallia californiensis]SDZ18784.1 SIR2-like domain-containing protein [Tindallia californiensis]
MNELKKIISEFKSLPYLFIGSGLSRRHLDTDDWEGLLKRFANMINTKSDSDSDYAYEKYHRQAINELRKQPEPYNDDSFLLPMVATMIQEDFDKKWFEDQQFSESRITLSKYVKNGVSPFKAEIAAFLKLRSDEANYNSDHNHELQSLKKAASRSINGVITTNFDTLIEDLFSDLEYEVYEGQQSLIFSPLNGIRDIFKIHGCCKKPDSITINHKDYTNFIKRNAYLSAKLITFFVEHPIIFLGYSITDNNIIKILESIVECLNSDNINELNNRLIFVQRGDGDGLIHVNNMIRQFGNKNIQMKQIKLDDYSIFYDELLNTKSRYSPRLLSQLKKDIFEMVVANKPSGKLIVAADIDDEQDINDIDVVIGVGMKQFAKQGVIGISTEEIFKDIIWNNLDLGSFPEMLVDFVNKALPKHLRDASGSLPFYKYIKDMDYSSLPRDISKHIKGDFDSFLNRNLLDNRKKRGDQYCSVQDVLVKNDELDKQLKELPLLTEDKINVDELGHFLKGSFPKDELLLQDPKAPHETDLRRIIKIYDWLLYKK